MTIVLHDRKFARLAVPTARHNSVGFRTNDTDPEINRHRQARPPWLDRVETAHYHRRFTQSAANPIEWDP